jgi:hypothetical protein
LPFGNSLAECQILCAFSPGKAQSLLGGNLRRPDWARIRSTPGQAGIHEPALEQGGTNVSRRGDNRLDQRSPRLAKRYLRFYRDRVLVGGVAVERLIVPSSIQRIRSFLVEMCGMKVKPWAGAEETLAALHTTLVARQGCDIFWTSLRVLLETLARDLKARQDAAPGALVDNEVLDGERYATLIDEIRAALARQVEGEPASTFRRLASALSAPALGLLLFLGGVATVGCASKPLGSSLQTHDAAATGLPDAGSSQPETKPDSSIYIQLPDAGSSQPETKPDSSIYIQLPDTRPAPDTLPPKYAATTGPDGGTVTIQDILDSCNIPAQQQDMILGCLGFMASSWSADLTSALAGADCMSVASLCRSGEVCSAEYYSGTTVPSSRLCMPVIIYAGVRFV